MADSTGTKPWSLRGASGRFLKRAADLAPVPENWLLDGLTRGDHVVIRESIGFRFGGEVEPAVAYLLDQWSNFGDGLRFRTFAGPEDPVNVGRATFIETRCFRATVLGLRRWAVSECKGQLETAVTRALREQLDRLGLSAAVAPTGTT